MLVAAVPASRSCIICLWATEQRAVEGGRLDRKSSTPLARATRDKESPDSELVRSTPGERVPLAALRLALDDDSAKADWSMNPDGVPGRSLMMPARCRVTLPVRLGEALFSSRAMLLPTTGATAPARCGSGSPSPIVRAPSARCSPDRFQRRLAQGQSQGPAGELRAAGFHHGAEAGHRPEHLGRRSQGRPGHLG